MRTCSAFLAVRTSGEREKVGIGKSEKLIFLEEALISVGYRKRKEEQRLETSHEDPGKREGE